MNVNVIENIEVSSLCDNKCPYCPASKQGKHRPVGLMTMETFEKTMKWLDYCVAKGTQNTQVNMYGVGEPTLNPLLPDMVRIVRNKLPPHVQVHLNTNGNTMTHELAFKLRDAGISRVDVTGHKARSAANCIRILKEAGIFGGLSVDFMLSPNNWAGQVKWLKPDYSYPCPWLGRGQVMVMWDGRVTRCSLDAFGTGIVGTVDDNPDTIELTPFELCKTCHQIPPVVTEPINMRIVNGVEIHTIHEDVGNSQLELLSTSNVKSEIGTITKFVYIYQEDGYDGGGDGLALIGDNWFRISLHHCSCSGPLDQLWDEFPQPSVDKLNMTPELEKELRTLLEYIQKHNLGGILPPPKVV